MKSKDVLQSPNSAEADRACFRDQ